MGPARGRDDVALLTPWRLRRVLLHEAGPLPNALFAWVVVLSIVSFVLMAHDKRQARRARRRIRERTLLIVSLIGGAPGGWAAMHLVRHKTRHMRFRIVLPLFALMWVALVIVTRRP